MVNFPSSEKVKSAGKIGFISLPNLAIFVPVVLVYMFAAYCLVALVWDGSSYLYNSLQAGSPLIVHQRYSNLLTLLPLVVLRELTPDPSTIAVGYGVLLAIVPVLSLTLSFYFLKNGRVDCLQIWPVLGILLMALPGEICLMSEASLAVQVCWPLLVFVLVGAPRREIIWVCFLVVYLFFLHPTAALLFLFLSIVSLAGSSLGVWRRSVGVVWGAIFGAAAILRLLYSLFQVDNYERAELAWKPNWDAFLGGVWGTPLLLIASTYLIAAGCLLFASGWIDSLKGRALLWGGALLVLVPGVWWAAQDTLWSGALGYRRFIMVATMPLMIMAGIHRYLLKRQSDSGQPGFFRQCAVVATWAFAIVFAVQANVWRTDVARFAKNLETAPIPFAWEKDFSWLSQTPLDHWSTTTLSIIVQGREPRTIFVDKPEAIREGNIELFNGEGGILNGRNSWFKIDLSERISRSSDSVPLSL